MKLLKKSVGIILVMIMLVNIFAVSSFAQISFPDKGVKMTIKSDKASYNAGDIATFYVYFESPLDLAGGQFSMSYDKTYLEPIVALDVATQTDPATAGVILPGYGFATTVDTTLSGVVDGSGMDATISDATEYSLDGTVFIILAVNPGVFYDFSKGAVAFALQMRVKSAVGEGYVSFNYDSYDNFNSYLTTESGDVYSGDNSMFSASVDANKPFQVVPCKFSVGQAGVDCNLDNNSKIRWSTDNTSNLVDIGFTGTINGLNLVTSGGSVQSGLYEVGVIFSISDANQKPTLADVNGTTVFSDTVGVVFEYDTNSDSTMDTWKFRAIAKNITYTSTQNIYAVMYIKTSDTAQPIYSQPTIITANYHYNRAVTAAAGFSAFAG